MVRISRLDVVAGNIHKIIGFPRQITDYFHKVLFVAHCESIFDFVYSSSPSATPKGVLVPLSTQCAYKLPL